MKQLMPLAIIDFKRRLEVLPRSWGSAVHKRINLHLMPFSNDCFKRKLALLPMSWDGAAQPEAISISS